MKFFTCSPLALLARFCMASLFVGTIWMASAGCEVNEHDDHWHHDHDDHDHHEHDRDWH